MSRYYIEAFDGEGRQILGNLDGQAALGDVKAPERCHAWKFLGTEKQPIRRKIRQWRLVNEWGRICAHKHNPYFLEQEK